MTIHETFINDKGQRTENMLAFNRAWSVHLRIGRHSIIQHDERPVHIGGYPYHYGMEPPRYPMPATFGQVIITSRNVYRANPQGWDSETYL